eukprot:1188627-Pyramimonas_sp.AAC.1
MLTGRRPGADGGRRVGDGGGADLPRLEGEAERAGSAGATAERVPHGLRVRGAEGHLRRGGQRHAQGRQRGG